MKKNILFAIILFSLSGCFQKPVPPYAVTNIATPVLYTADFRSAFGNGALEDMTNVPNFQDYGEGNRLHIDPWGEIDELEFIAFPGTVFEILERHTDAGNTIYRVTTHEYPSCETSEKGCYVDARFVEVATEQPPERGLQLPTEEEIIANMMSAERADYVWGGNWKDGIPELLEFYPPKDADIPEILRDQWTLKGVDCSGLLYEATNGFTPRNTSELIAFGIGVEIADLNAEEIAQKLLPLDLIVWKGHNLIVIDEQNAIESIVDFIPETDAIEEGGVRIVPLQERLEQILEDRVPVNDYDDEVPEDMKKFVIRRWYQASGE